MTSRDQAVGGMIFTVCLTVAVAYVLALFWPALEAIRLWLVATTPTPKPIEETQETQTEETEVRK